MRWWPTELAEGHEHNAYYYSQYYRREYADYYQKDART
jgi:hypothetical protein